MYSVVIFCHNFINCVLSWGVGVGQELSGTGGCIVYIHTLERGERGENWFTWFELSGTGGFRCTEFEAKTCSESIQVYRSEGAHAGS